jgi:hypothetical protein
MQAPAKVGLTMFQGKFLMFGDLTITHEVKIRIVILLIFANTYNFFNSVQFFSLNLSPSRQGSNFKGSHINFTGLLTGINIKSKLFRTKRKIWHFTFAEK